MKKLQESTRTADSLPAFLDSHSATAEAGGAQGDTTTEVAEPAAAPADEAAVTAEADLAATTADPAAEPEVATAAPAAAAPSPGPRGSLRRTNRSTGTVSLALAFLAVVAVPATAMMPELATTYGFTPNMVFLLAALLAAAGMTQRHIGHMQQRLDEADSRRRAEADAVQQNLQLLVDDSQREKAPAQGEELQHVLMSLQRQDEKINNLTKAIKMYGKPLMEISGQGTELASSLANIKTLVEGGTETSRQSVGRLEAQLRTATHGKELAEIHGAVQQLAARLETLANKTSTVSFEPVQQQLGRLEVAVAAVAQRLEDSEVRKSLLRLEEATQRSRETMQELLKGEPVREATKVLQSRVDSATKGLADGLAQLRDGNLGGLENAVRDIQREMSGVATTVAQINAAVKGSGLRVAAAPAPAPTAPVAAPAATAAPAPTPGSAPSADPAAANADGKGSYATGARTTGSKNVLGAIAKLKQMKG